MKFLMFAFLTVFLLVSCESKVTSSFNDLGEREGLKILQSSNSLSDPRSNNRFHVEFTLDDFDSRFELVTNANADLSEGIVISFKRMGDALAYSIAGGEDIIWEHGNALNRLSFDIEVLNNHGGTSAIEIDGVTEEEQVFPASVGKDRFWGVRVQGVQNWLATVEKNIAHDHGHQHDDHDHGDGDGHDHDHDDHREDFEPTAVQGEFRMPKDYPLRTAPGQELYP